MTIYTYIDIYIEEGQSYSSISHQRKNSRRDGVARLDPISHPIRATHRISHPIWQPWLQHTAVRVGSDWAGKSGPIWQHCRNRSKNRVQSGNTVGIEVEIGSNLATQSRDG